MGATMIHGSTTPENEKDLLATPFSVYNYLNKIYKFDVDLAANDSNKKHSTFIDPLTNSLLVDWLNYGNTGFLNPPYSDIYPWMLKAISNRDRFRTVMLIPSPNGESLYLLVEQFASSITLVHGRISFLDIWGNPKIGNPRGSCIVVFDNHRRGSCELNWINRDHML